MKGIFNVFRIIMANLILISFNSASKPIISVSELPYGYWWLLNPQAIEPNLIAGGLMICHQDDKTSCAEEAVMLVLLERNTGHGCTDYVGTGNIKQNPDSKQWQIFLEEDGKHTLWATVVKTANNLVLKLSNSNNRLKLQQAKSEDIDKNAISDSSNELKLEWAKPEGIDKNAISDSNNELKLEWVKPEGIDKNAISDSNNELKLKLELKQVKLEDIDKNAKNACDRSLKDYLKSKRSSR